MADPGQVMESIAVLRATAPKTQVVRKLSVHKNRAVLTSCGPRVFLLLRRVSVCGRVQCLTPARAFLRPGSPRETAESSPEDRLSAQSTRYSTAVAAAIRLYTHRSPEDQEAWTICVKRGPVLHGMPVTPSAHRPTTVESSLDSLR